MANHDGHKRSDQHGFQAEPSSEDRRQDAKNSKTCGREHAQDAQHCRRQRNIDRDEIYDGRERRDRRSQIQCDEQNPDQSEGTPGPQRSRDLIGHALSLGARSIRAAKLRAAKTLREKCACLHDVVAHLSDQGFDASEGNHSANASRELDFNTVTIEV